MRSIPAQILLPTFLAVAFNSLASDGDAVKFPVQSNIVPSAAVVTECTTDPVNCVFVSGFDSCTEGGTNAHPDKDGDDYGDAASGTIVFCAEVPAGYVTNNDDCDDWADTVNPDAVEVCDDLDNDCDDVIDEGCPVCGNGELEDTEDCDDGNTEDGDGCSSICTFEVCGDSLVGAGEDCDAGGVNTVSCDSDCSFPQCGDGLLNLAAGEACDDGGIDTETCNFDCTLAQCGDFYLNTAAGEECDDGNTEDGDGCSSLCKVELCEAAPAAPSSLSATVVSSSRVDLEWTDNSVSTLCAADSFGITRNDIEIAITAGPVTSYADTTVASGNQYEYKVRAYRGGEGSGFSNTVNVQVGGSENVTVPGTSHGGNRVGVNLPPNVTVTISNVGGTVCLDGLGIGCTGPGGVTASSCNEETTDECVCPPDCANANYGQLMRDSCTVVSNGNDFNSGGAGTVEFFVNGDCNPANNTGSFSLTLSY